MTMVVMEDMPTRRDILDWIRVEHPKVGGEKARVWAQFLVGLRWEHLKPVVSISANTSVPPALAMASVSAYTADETVKQAFREHLDRA